jgi:hypothetical protein
LAYWIFYLHFKKGEFMSDKKESAFVDVESEIIEYKRGKKSVTTGFWMFAALATTFVIVVSAYVNWSAGFARGELLGGLIAVALDVALVTMGLRSWRGHNWFQTGVDWLCIITLMIVGITCVALYFGIENNRAQYDMNMDLNNALLSTVSANSANATNASIQENNAQIRSIAKSVKAPPPKETKTFESLARFVGVDNPDDMTFLFNMLMGVALVISSVLMSTRVNSYYSSIQLNQLAKSIRENNKAIDKALNHQTSTADKEGEAESLDTQRVEPVIETGPPTATQHIDDKFNRAKSFIDTHNDGEKVTATKVKSHLRINPTQWKELRKELVNKGALTEIKPGKGNGSASTYYKPKKADKNANVFAMNN